MATIHTRSTAPDLARPTAPSFDLATSLTLDAIIVEIESEPAPNPLRRAYLKLCKRWYERSIEAYQPAARMLVVAPELLEEAA
jgi:hypothetical protein